MIRYNQKMVTTWDDFAHVLYVDNGKGRMMLQIGDNEDEELHYEIDLYKNEAEKLAKMLLDASKFMEDVK